MKTLKIVAVMLILAGGLASCEEKEQVMQQGCVNEWCFYARVENTSKYSHVVEVKLMVHDNSINRYVELARSDWKDGGFTIALPEALTPSNLNPLIRGRSPADIYFVQPTMTISNENVRVGNVYFVGVDKDGNAVATFSPLAVPGGVWGNTEALFTYVDSDVVFSGFIKGRGHAIPAFPGAPSWFEETITYSVKWEKGWNIWYLSRSSTVTGYTMIMEVQWSTIPVSDLKWYASEEYLWKFLN